MKVLLLLAALLRAEPVPWGEPEPDGAPAAVWERLERGFKDEDPDWERRAWARLGEEDQGRRLREARAALLAEEAERQRAAQEGGPDGAGAARRAFEGTPDPSGRAARAFDGGGAAAVPDAPHPAELPAPGPRPAPARSLTVQPPPAIEAAPEPEPDGPYVPLRARVVRGPGAPAPFGTVGQVTRMLLTAPAPREGLLPEPPVASSSGGGLSRMGALLERGLPIGYVGVMPELSFRRAGMTLRTLGDEIALGGSYEPGARTVRVRVERGLGPGVTLSTEGGSGPDGPAAYAQLRFATDKALEEALGAVFGRR